MDFGGICFLIAGSAYPIIYYNLACPQEYKARNFFVWLISVSSVITFILCMIPQMSTPRLRPFRATMFVVLGVSTAFPLFYIAYGADKRYVNPEWLRAPYWKAAFFYIVGAVLYALRMPERYFPKRFDNFGSSHQIFHVGVVAGTVIIFNAGMDQYISRKKFICPIELPPYE